MVQPPKTVYEVWSETGTNVAIGLCLLSVAIYVIYLIASTMISNRSKKYNFIYKYERNVMMTSAIGLALTIAIMLNIILLDDLDFRSLISFMFKAFIPLCGVVMVTWFIRVYLTIYYPSTLDKKLTAIRFKERAHNNGLPMKLLNEQEEDEYLTSLMIKQERELKYDFDVWLEESSGETIIETYKGSIDRECNKCHFKTLKLAKEEITEDKTKQLVYKCTYCQNVVKE